MVDQELTTWLLDADPALRWQVERDLVREPEPVWQATRARVPTEGFGARLLAKQGADGQWAGGAFFPGGGWSSDAASGETVPDEPAHPDDDGPRAQPWLATTWSLTSLREWGVEAEVLGDTAARLEAVCRWEYDDLPYWSGEVDVCINAMTLANGTWLGAAPDQLATLRRWFGEHEAAEGGWNCEWENGSTRASVVSTLNAARGLLAHEVLRGGDPEIAACRHRAEEYLLQRRLLHRLTTGELVVPYAKHLGHPFRGIYSSLAALDHFRRAAAHDDTPPDPRLSDAVEALRADRQPDGSWVQERRHPGRVWFETDAPVGERSRWLTLVGTRVLEWWESGSGA